MAIKPRHRSTLPKFTDRLPLGAAGLQVSPFCLGAVASEDTIPAAFDAGINFFFLTADYHWPYYEKSRRGLKKLLARRKNIRDQVVVAATSYVTQPEFCGVAFGELVEAIPGLSSVDVAVAGGAYSWEFMARLQRYLEIREVSAHGTKAIGASFHDRRAALFATQQQLVAISFIRYNPTHLGARLDLFPFLDAPTSTLLYNFTSTMGYVGPKRWAQLEIGKQHWRPECTDYYRFALTRPQFDGLLCAPQTPRQVQVLADALEKGPLGVDEEKHLIDLADLDQGLATLQR